MPDERDTQSAAPSTDGDTSQDRQATATQEPPEPAAAEGGQADGAPASPAADPQPKTDAEARGEQGEPAVSSDDGSSATAAAEETRPEETGAEETGAEGVEAGEESGPQQAATGEAGGEPEPAKAAAEKTADEPAEAAPESRTATGEEPKTGPKTEPDTGEATPAAAQTETGTEGGEELQPEAAEAIAEAGTGATGTVEAPATEAAEAQAAPSPEAAEEPKTAPQAAETPAAETPAAETQPAEAQAAETQAAETQAAETQAAEAQAAETQAAEAQAAEATPAAAETVAGAATDEAAGTGPAAKEADSEEAGAGDPAEAAKAASDEGKEPAPPELDDPTLKELRKAKEEGTTVTGKVIGWNRGGFHVVIDEVTAFCPASEMELGRPRSPDTYMDREMEFKVAKFQRRGRRVVLSRSEVLKNQRDEILASLQPGKVVQGNVTSLPDFGAFVDLGGIEGLVHVSEISRARVKKPSDVLRMGQEVEVKILKIEQGGDRISLSMKELEPDPWKDIAEKYPRGSKFTGKILRHADFGMFVELEPDVEGLVHVSQLEPGQEMSDEALQPGKTIEGWIREVEPKRERISLSLREVPEEDPWKTVQTRFPEGETVEGTVESIAPFGVFIHLAPGLTGLLPNSQTGLPRGTSAARAFRPGQTVEIQVLSIDTRRKRISLGKPGARVEATKADLQEYRKQQKEQEKKAPSAMEAAFARLGLGGEEGDEG